MCLRCAKAAYSSSIPIQLQLEDSAKLPLIGRAAKGEELVRLTVEHRVPKVLAARKSNSMLENITIGKKRQALNSLAVSLKTRKAACT